MSKDPKLVSIENKKYTMGVIYPLKDKSRVIYANHI